MKLTLKEIMAARNAFQMLLSMKMTSQATMFRLKRLAKQLFPIFEDFDAQSQETFDRFSELNEAKVMEVKSPEKIKEYKAAVKELMAVEVEVDFEPFKLFDLRVHQANNTLPEEYADGLHWVTSAILIDLDWLIKE